MMFRQHTQHLQSSFVDTVAQLSAARQERLEHSWAGEFYREVFCRLDETIFANVYSDVPSRPNTPVNQLVGIEILKSAYNWSDEELFDHLAYDLQTRYALGVRDIESDICTLRTVYHFRRRVSQHRQASGENLLEQAFAQVTDAQRQALQLDTHRQRMDSTQIASNIREYSRLQLVLEVLQRAARMLTAADQARYAETLMPYQESSAGRYCYRLKQDEYAPHLVQVGCVIAQLLTAWAAAYAADPAYQLLQRVFHEHFNVADPEHPVAITAKPPEELSAASLQAPDDRDATYRRKNGQSYRGYVINVSETDNPANPLQLITQLQVAPNSSDDQALLVAAIPKIQARMPLTDLDIDGGYTGPDATQKGTDCNVNLHPTAIRGAQSAADTIGLAAFTWEYPADAPAQVTCPHGQTASLCPGRKAGRYHAAFAADACAECPLRDQCPTQPLKRRPQRRLRVSRRQIEVAQLRQACTTTQSAGPPYLRPAVEATVRSIKHPFRGRLPVRGLARVSMLIIASGFMVNLRRIWRYRQEQRAEARKNSAQEQQSLAQDSFLSRCRVALHRLFSLPQLLTTRRYTMGCC